MIKVITIKEISARVNKIFLFNSFTALYFNAVDSKGAYAQQYKSTTLIHIYAHAPEAYQIKLRLIC